MSQVNWEQISQYIFPVLLVLFYLFSGGKKKKPQNRAPAPERRREEREEAFLPPLPPREQQVEQPFGFQETPKSLPPVQRKLSHLESAITDRRLKGQIEGRHYVSAISNQRAESLVSAGLIEHIDLDEAYAQKPRHQVCRGRAILKHSSSLKEAFILQEILKKPEF